MQNAETGLAKRNSSYDMQQKAKLVELGLSDKPYSEILMYLENEIKQSRRMANFNYRVLCFKDDGVFQLNKAIEKVYGVSAGKDDGNPSKKPSNLETVDVTLADGTRLKVPYGTIELPDLGDDAQIQIGYDNKSNELIVKGSVQFRHNSMIDEIVETTRYNVRHNSIYKGQAIELEDNFVPKVMQLDSYAKEFMVLNEQTEFELQPLMSRIRYPQECLDNNVPLKYGTLIEGPYGTGKTLAVFKMGYEAIDNGWIFIYLKTPSMLAQVLMLCKAMDKNGFGVIIFVEDIDQVVTGERDDAMQRILNTLDGGDTKQMNVIALFTTNHIEKINPTFLRGKRIGSLVSMGPFKANTARKYLEHAFSMPFTLQQEGLEQVCEEIEKAKIVPAFMAEICDTVRSNAIFSKRNVVEARHIRMSLESYLRQVELANKKDTGESLEQKFANSFVEILAKGEMGKQVKAVYEANCC